MPKNSLHVAFNATTYNCAPFPNTTLAGSRHAVAVALEPLLRPYRRVIGVTCGETLPGARSHHDSRPVGLRDDFPDPHRREPAAHIGAPLPPIYDSTTLLRPTRTQSLLIALAIKLLMLAKLTTTIVMTEPSPQSTIKPEQSHQSRVAVAVGSRQPPRPRPRIWRGGPWMPVCVRVCAMSLPVSRERDAQIGRMTNRVGCACGRSAPGTAKNRETTGSFAEALVPAATHGGLPCGCVGVGLLASDLARNAGPGTTASPSRPRALCDDAEKHREATITNPHLSHTRDGH